MFEFCNYAVSIGKKGFTLMELLIVIALAAFIVSLVTPRAIFMYDRLSAKMNQLQWKGLAERTSYEAFIRQAKCILAMNESESRVYVATITCANKSIYEKNLTDADRVSTELLFADELPMIFNAGGFRVVTGKQNYSNK